MYPLPLADATPESVETVFERFIDLQAAWEERFAAIVARARERGSAEDDEESAAEGPAAEGGGTDGFIINP